jgi:glycosyltransferase involved in cell wall biosynthesis
MSDPAVSIITRTHDRPLTLGRAIQSVLGQSFSDWELVLVNDAGRPDVVDRVIAPYREALAGRCRVLHRERSTGMEAASNFGISRSRGRYVVLHDDDDSWHPDFLARTSRELLSSRKPLQGVVSGTQMVREEIEGEAIRELGRELLPSPPQPLTAAALRRRNRFPPIAFVYDRAAWQSIGGYREDLRALGDWDFNVRFAARFAIRSIPDLLAFWHLRPGAKRRQAVYANSPYRDHMDCMMRLRREWGETPPVWRYLMWWRY